MKRLLILVSLIVSWQSIFQGLKAQPNRWVCEEELLDGISIREYKNEAQLLEVLMRKGFSDVAVLIENLKKDLTDRRKRTNLNVDFKKRLFLDFVYGEKTLQARENMLLPNLLPVRYQKYFNLLLIPLVETNWV